VYIASIGGSDSQYFVVACSEVDKVKGRIGVTEFDINTNIINGLSTDELIKNKVREFGHFDLIYIDGGHNYDCVVSDIKLMYDVSKIGTYVVFDDSSCFKNLSNDKFKGHIDVCNAIKDHIENNDQFTELVCVGHNRVFKKIKNG
jgi:hypothetical protein